MILSKEEAICFLINNSKDKRINSATKLNKLVANLNMHMIPTEVHFQLNKFGSYSPELDTMLSTDYYDVTSESYSKYQLRFKPKCEQACIEIDRKILTIMTPEELSSLKKEINELSEYSAEELSIREHKMLLVDVADKELLKQRARFVMISFKDLYDDRNIMKDLSFSHIILKGLIEYCYHLALFLHEKFEKSPENEYDAGASMSNYYLLGILNNILPFIEKQVKTSNLDASKIKRSYNSLTVMLNESNHPLSLNNPNLKDVACV